VLSLVYPSRTRGLLSVLKTNDDETRLITTAAWSSPPTSFQTPRATRT